MKNRLLQAMKSLPMLAEDKEKFIDIIINKSNSGGGSKLGYLYFRNIPGDGSYPIASFFEELIKSFNQAGSPPINPTVKHEFMGIIPFTFIPDGSGGGIEYAYKICVNNYVPMQNIIPFYDFIEFCIDNKYVNADKSSIEIFKANEITEEEFLEGVEFGVPEM